MALLTHRSAVSTGPAADPAAGLPAHARSELQSYATPKLPFFMRLAAPLCFAGALHAAMLVGLDNSSLTQDEDLYSLDEQSPLMISIIEDTLGGAGEVEGKVSPLPSRGVTGPVVSSAPRTDAPEFLPAPVAPFAIDPEKSEPTVFILPDPPAATPELPSAKPEEALADAAPRRVSDVPPGYGQPQRKAEPAPATSTETQTLPAPIAVANLPAPPKTFSTAGIIFAVRRGGDQPGTAPVMEKLAGRKAKLFTLPGRPSFPRACRIGLCRHGWPCEGVSEWRITVPSTGGEPEKIECLQRLECELQNAAVRKYFSLARFPATAEAMVYRFTVNMYARDYPEPNLMMDGTTPEKKRE